MTTMPRRWISALALLLIACGGGGGTGTPVVPPPPPGFAGTIRCEDFDLGRMIEEEPNDGRETSHRLPPLAARARLEVTGTLAVDGDGIDAFRVETLSGQDLSVTLGWAEPGGAADLGFEIFEPGEDLPLTSSGVGASPRTALFPAAAGRVYEVVVTAASARASYVLAFQALDGVLAAAPVGTAAVAGAPPAALAPAPEAGLCATTHVLVGLREGGVASRLAARFGLRVGRRTGNGAFKFHLDDGAGERRTARIRAWCERLREDPDVTFAEPDWVVHSLGTPNDPEFSRQWNLRAIQAPEAWAVTRGEREIIVGVVDSGIVTHPDLDGQIAPGGYDFISDPDISGDGSGRDPNPIDVGAREYPSGRSQWHGTHVSGIIAAVADDGVGIAGVAPGCRVMVFRALGRTGGFVSDVADAILYGAGLLTTEDGRRLSQPVRVLNLSFGLNVDSSLLRSACDRARDAGVLLVGATGNDGQAVLYPAAYASVVAVGAVDASLETMDYSNFGREVDLAAPGGDLTSDQPLDGWPDGILSTLLDETAHPVRTSHGYLEGTSQAAPHVAGVAALLFSVDPTLTAARVKSLLTGSALDLGETGKDVAYGWGLVQAHEAMRLLLDDMGTPIDAPPALWMPTFSLSFLGFDERCEVPVGNGGGGRLVFGDPLVETDDGGDWLFVVQDEDPTGALPASVRSLEVTIDRKALPLAKGTFGGTVWVRDPAGGVLGRLRVLAYAGERPFAGEELKVRTLHPTTGLPGTIDVASAAFGYRYYMPVVTSGSWKIQAGQDVDGNGFFCGGGEACGWYGGASEAEASVVESERVDPVRGLDIVPILPR